MRQERIPYFAILSLLVLEKNKQIKLTKEEKDHLLEQTKEIKKTKKAIDTDLKKAQEVYKEAFTEEKTEETPKAKSEKKKANQTKETEGRNT